MKKITYLFLFIIVLAMTLSMVSKTQSMQEKKEHHQMILANDPMLEERN